MFPNDTKSTYVAEKPKKSSGKTDIIEAKETIPPPNYDSTWTSLESTSYAPPPGAPPGFWDVENQHVHDFHPTAGSPPGFSVGPPPGPPPGFSAGPSYGPPSGPPPGSQGESSFSPPDYAPPDTSNFEPIYSNADDDERDAGDKFCSQYRIQRPGKLSQSQLQLMLSRLLSLTPAPVPMRSGFISSQLQAKNRFKGEIQQGQGDGTCYIRSRKTTKDCTFVSQVPLYSPLHPNESRLYFEITLTELKNPMDSVVAIGFTCLPYPGFRLPGWHRGSLAVHSDDGRRYVNDSLSGKNFTRPFASGETIGLGIDFSRQLVFLTRNGKFDSSWSLLEGRNSRGVDPEREYRDGDIQGLTGDSELFAAVGIYGEVGVTVNFGGKILLKYKA